MPLLLPFSLVLLITFIWGGGCSSKLLPVSLYHFISQEYLGLDLHWKWAGLLPLVVKIICTAGCSEASMIEMRKLLTKTGRYWLIVHIACIYLFKDAVHAMGRGPYDNKMYIIQYYCVLLRMILAECLNIALKTIYTCVFLAPSLCVCISAFQWTSESYDSGTAKIQDLF